MNWEKFGIAILTWGKERYGSEPKRGKICQKQMESKLSKTAEKCRIPKFGKLRKKSTRGQVSNRERIGKQQSIQTNLWLNLLWNVGSYILDT